LDGIIPSTSTRREAGGAARDSGGPCLDAIPGANVPVLAPEIAFGQGLNEELPSGTGQVFAREMKVRL